MKTGFRGTFVVSWAQTELDGLINAPTNGLAVGAAWRWSGRATRVDGPGDILMLGQCEESLRVRRHAARMVRRLVQNAMAPPQPVDTIPAPDEPILDSGFAITDGTRSFTATLVELPQRKTPLLMFLDEVPPVDTDLWITHVAHNICHTNRVGDLTPHVICFTPGTMIATPDGARRVADLREDDLILTKDDGPQPIRWMGHRRMTGARFVTMPELRPIRIRSGAMGIDQPDGDLWVSPEHRMLLRGKMAEALFNTDEVLVAAKDLVNDSTIVVDRLIPEVTYVHILLDRHQIVFANGLESESFHPATMPVDAVALDQRDALLDRVPGIDRDPSVYGAFTRRRLSSAEAAILLHRGMGH